MIFPANQLTKFCAETVQSPLTLEAWSVVYTPMIGSSLERLDKPLGERSFLLVWVRGHGHVAHLGAVMIGGVSTTMTNQEATVVRRSTHRRQMSPAVAQFFHSQPVDDRIKGTFDVRQQVHVVDERCTAKVSAGRRVEGQYLEYDKRHEERVQGQQNDTLKVISPGSQVHEMRSTSANKTMQ